jgi:tRNA-uridine 2-sulfurtransferase
MRIMVAMSGGVDSSVAAALLKKQGHDVIGATMQLQTLADDGNPRDTFVADAQKVAEELDIQHYVFDFSDVFSGTIIDYFCKEYLLGRTPNPCVLCNRFIKFGMLMEKAREMGASYLATGHYAGIKFRDGRFVLKKGIDLNKDQSYFLYRLNQDQLARVMFPLAELKKDEVKTMARKFMLPAAERPESQEICFVPDDDYAEFVESYTSTIALPGAILDDKGKTIGQHHGITHYTIGQRKGLGIASPEPLYVTSIDAKNNTLTVGTKEQIYSYEMVAGDLNWIAFDPPDRTFKVQARVRYRAQDVEAIITPLDNKELFIKFSTPQMAITPGQSVVFYDDTTVIGGGIIKRQGR